MRTVLRFRLWISLGLLAAALVSTGPHLFGHHLHEGAPLCPVCLLAAGAFDQVEQTTTPPPPPTTLALTPAGEKHFASQDPARCGVTRAPPAI